MAGSSTFSAIPVQRPPAAAPHVVVILLDDVGFGASSTFGGPVRTPVADRLAEGGLRYSRFHTTGLCSPTRVALLTGRNHHGAGMGTIADLATSSPGYTSVRPHSVATLAEMLRRSGYATAQFGKCHEVPPWEATPAGPFERWPTGSGFEHFYGFVGGEINQYFPVLHEGTRPVDPPRGPREGYHFTEDITDRAIDWLNTQRRLLPDRPVFLYWAPGATHSPHQVPAGWSDAYRGAFDDGWDHLRPRIFETQKQLGVVPPDCSLTPRPREISAWESIPVDFYPALARQMEVYAGFLEHTDAQVGRLADALEELSMMENTLFFYVLGDNGASGEGMSLGTLNTALLYGGLHEMETAEYLNARLDEYGGPTAYNTYAVGWAHALGTPYQWTKQVASHWGGTRNGLVVHWPRGISPSGEIRSQFFHVIDIAPTVLAAAGIAFDPVMDGVPQKPLDGRDMGPTFDDARAPEEHTRQYFETSGNRGIYEDGWTAVTKHMIPWAWFQSIPAFEDDIWELYAPSDWTQSDDLAEQQPQRLEALKAIWVQEAERFGVLPLDDRGVERTDPATSGRPVLVSGQTQILPVGCGPLPDEAVLEVNGRSHAVTARIVLSEIEASGVVVTRGGCNGGWSLYFLGGRLTYCYNLAGVERTVVAATETLAAGEHVVGVVVRMSSESLTSDAVVDLEVDGSVVGRARIPATAPAQNEPFLDVGRSGGSPVTEDYDSIDNRFNGRIAWVRIDVDGDVVAQVSEARYQAVLSRQ